MTLNGTNSMARYGRWLVALLLAGGAHATALAIAIRTADLLIDPEASGAFHIELAPLATTVPTPPLESPPGLPNVDSIEAQALAPIAEAKEAQLEPELFPLPELAMMPADLTLPKFIEKQPEKPPEEIVEQQQQPTPAQDANAASRATAPPKIEDAIVTERAAITSVGTTSRDRKLQERWQSALSAHLVKHGRFPATVRELGRERQVRVRFKLDRQGKVIDVAIVESSGLDQLDSAAEEMVRRASPMPLPPEQVQADALDLVVPIQFKARR